MPDDAELIEIRAAYVRYLLMKAAQADWHGVSDAANDLREFEARYPDAKWLTIAVSWR